MNVSAAGMARIASSDRLRPIGALQRGVAVVGYSHTRTAVVGQAVTRGEAMALLRDDLDRLAPQIEAVLPVAVAQKVFDLLAFYAWRTGLSGFVQSALFRELVAGKSSPRPAVYSEAPRGDGGGSVPAPPGQDDGPPKQSQL